MNEVAMGGLDDRATLARWMLGQWIRPVDPVQAQERAQELMGLAWGEGVAALVGYGLDGQAGVPEALRRPLLDLCRDRAMTALVRRGRLGGVLRALRAADIPVLVLKGAALAKWLYPKPYLRETSDVDLLFASRSDAMRAAVALQPLGFAVPAPPTRFRHGVSSPSADGQMDLDLHWALSDWPLLAGLPDFDALLADSVPLPGLEAGAHGLGAPHALLHACVHRASNLSAGLGDRLKWLYDLHLLAARLDMDGAWPRFVECCQESRAGGICAEGLAASAAHFGTVVPMAAMQALEAMRAHEPLDARRLADWRYVQRCNFRAMSGWRVRLAWLRHRLLPSDTHLRELYGAELSRSALLRERLRRAWARLRRRTPD